MNPLDFVAGPDWRSVVLAVTFVIPWLGLLAGRRLGRLVVWAALTAGIILFPLSIAWVQAPIQQGINTLYVRWVPAQTLDRYALIFGTPVVVVSGLVQETVKFAVTVAALRLARDGRALRTGLAVGAACGAGYGGAEAFWIFNQIFGAGLSWATVQLLGPAALVGFLERLFTVAFHVAAPSLAAYGYASRRPLRFLLLAIGLHSLANYPALLLQRGAMGIWGAEIWVGVLSAATMAAALWLRARTRGD